MRTYGGKMKVRRKLIFALGASAIAAPLASFAQQQGKVWRIGFLLERSQSHSIRPLEAFKAGLREFGYSEGRDYVVEQRSADGNLARLPALAAELLALKVDLIVTSGTPSATAARDATREIPILITTVGNAISSGLAVSFSHPGGNVTGLTTLTVDLAAKRLDLLRQLVPGIRRVGFVHDPNNAADVRNLSQFESDCEKLGFKPISAPVGKQEEIVNVFTQLARDKAQGIAVSFTSRIAEWRAGIIEQAAKHRLPAMYGQNIFVEAGGLISYAPNPQDLYRRAAGFAGKIFKGAKPRDLPIELPLKFETVINLKTAKALGIKIPDAIMLRADKVIE
jgi:putative ABC transport system substrate-binding protein